MPKIKIIELPEMKSGGNWIQDAVNPAHKGFCTPMTKSTCTPKRKAFAMTMKKHHGFHKKEEGGLIPEMKQGGRLENTGMPNYNNHAYWNNFEWYRGLGPGTDMDVNSTMTAIDRDKANIEAEKGELIVKPDLGGLYKIGGKKHSQGGTPLNAETGSFIFSDDPKLAITKKEKELFEFKDGGSNAKSKNTPAKILSREVSPKEYNKHLAILQDETSDNIAKTTAMLMLEKMQNKIGQVAYLQESKKKSVIPEFAMGTAPLKDPEFEDIKEKSAQYMAYGGPMIPQIDPEDAYPGGKTKKGRKTPKGVANTFNYPGGVDKLVSDWQGVGVDLSDLNTKQSQGAMYDWALKNNPQLLRDLWSNYGNTARGIKKGLNFNYDNLSDDQLTKAKDSFTDNMLGVRVFSPIKRNLNPSRPTASTIPFNPNINVQPPTSGPSIGEPQAPPVPTLPYDIQGKLNNSQLANLGYLGLNAMNIKTYYPKREQVDLPEVRLDKVSAQPYLNNINNQAYAANQLAATNSRSAAINAGNIYGKSVDQTSQTLGNVNNQNIQIGNQENMTNLQQRTNQIMANTQFDDKYYDQLQTTKQNADNERRFARNQFMGTLNQYQSQADQLAWGLASVNKYGRKPVYDKSGKLVAYQPTPLYEYTGKGIKYNADVADLNMATGADRVNSSAEIKKIMSDFGLSASDPKQLYAFARLFDAISGKGKQPVYTNNPYIPQ
jgi:hypothetical protein